MGRFVNNDHQEVLNGIMDYYYSKIKGNYIPAILDEGSLFDVEGFVNDDLYIKLIAVKKDVKVRETWMLHNLSMTKEDECFNFIVEYKYLRNSIFGIHPDLLCDSSVSLCEQNEDRVLAIEYLDSNHKINGDRILKTEDKSVYIYFPFIRNYSDKTEFTYDYDYDLYIEIEYRTFNDDLSPLQKGLINCDNGVIDLSYEENSAGLGNNVKKLYWFRATIKLDTDKILSNKVENESIKVSVVDLETNTIRPLNPDNYDDDMHAGLIVFSNEVVDLIKSYYYFYDLTLIPKVSRIRSSLVDVFPDYVVFWEGEFNSNLPYELKLAMQKFNINTVKESIISEPMYQSQLMAQWDIYKYLLPNQQLARQILKKYSENAFEHGIDFYPPRDIKEYGDFVAKILKITGIKIDNLHISAENKAKLYSIKAKKYAFESDKDIFNNYQGLCLLLLKELGLSNEQE